MSERLSRCTALPIRGGTIETEFRAIFGREATTTVSTRVNAESPTTVVSLMSNATAILVYQLKCSIAVNAN